jgi:hypothetical protein
MKYILFIYAIGAAYQMMFWLKQAYLKRGEVTMFDFLGNVLPSIILAPMSYIMIAADIVIRRKAE